jgi:hypothetical protein
VLLTGAKGQSLDREAPVNSKVVTLGIERDGFRACRLVLTASMLDEATSESWAGVYFTDDACKQ